MFSPLLANQLAQLRYKELLEQAESARLRKRIKSNRPVPFSNSTRLIAKFGQWRGRQTPIQASPDVPLVH